MSDGEDFNKLVDRAMANDALANMRPVVEKELLHYEIFQALDAERLLKDLVFQGGTSLRLCRGSDRFSEDLDFAGGVNFSSESMERIKACVEKRIGERFGLVVSVKEKPGKVGADSGGRVKVDKWMISIQTNPGNRAMPMQKIKLEIANIPARTRELVPLIANYESARALPTVLVNAETLNEIMADKVLAFPTSLLNNDGTPVELDSTKIRHRDIWDLAWMTQKGAKLDPSLVVAKISDYGLEDYGPMLDRAIERLPDIIRSPQFLAQMTRFIDRATVDKTIANPAYLSYLSTASFALFSQMRAPLP